jgi:hypothetical protein
VINLGMVDLYIKEHSAELMQEADQVRLADEAVGPGRPMRMRLAEWLHTVAKWLEGTPSPEWIEGTPGQPTLRAHA